MEKKNELKESDLAKLSSGSNIDTNVHTMMECSRVECGYKIEWEGDYLNQVFECPHCFNESFKGTLHIYSD